jgi:hypothetical protein
MKGDRMRLQHALAAAVLMLGAHASAQTPQPAFDASTPLESRIGGTVPALTMQMHANMGWPAPAPYLPTEAEKQKVAAAFALLTPLQRSVAQKRLRSISFATGLQSNAAAIRVGSGDSETFEIVFNAIILKETVSDFLTRKERQLFDTSGSSLNVWVDGGSMDAVVYILLHEVTHVVDMSLDLSPKAPFRGPIPDEAQTAFTRGIWQSASRLAAPYHDPIFERVNFAPNAKTIPISEAKSLYEALGRTPAVSIYATRGYPEDLAETVAWREMTRKLNQPYRIEIRDGDRTVHVYEPAKNPLVQGRFGQLARFDSAF